LRTAADSPIPARPDAGTWLVGHLLDRGVDPRALMAACGLVALVPAAFWASVQAAFRRAEPRDTAAA